MDIVRDPLWNNIRLDDLALALLDTPVVQRLRYVRQLGLAYLVYPGATHSRFEHALGAYHLAGTALRLLDERGELASVDRRELPLVRAAALLHDVGHYPFSHALEEIGVPHHEDVARPLLLEGPVAAALVSHLGNDAPQRIHDLVTGRGTLSLKGLISGSLDLDKIEYLKRDAHMCGVPYGEIDVDRLLNSIVVVEQAGAEDRAGRGIGILAKGLSALESLLFAKYQMYRNVYWHHAVRSATAMYKRLVAEALAQQLVDPASLAHYTDEGLLHHLDALPLPPVARALLDGLRYRRLAKRAFECSASELPDGAGEWLASDYDLTRRVEDALAFELGLPPGTLLLDYPAKTQMLGLELPVRGRDGAVRMLTARGWSGAIDLPKLSDELYRAARRLRVFTLGQPTAIPRDALLSLVQRPAGEVRARLMRGASLLAA